MKEHEYLFKKAEERLKRILKFSPLKFNLHKTITIESKNAKDFISKEFFELNKTVKTIHLDGMTQCIASRDRAIEDIFIITNYYFPNTSLKETYEGLLNIGDELEVFQCQNVQKAVFSKRRYHQKGFTKLMYMTPSRLKMFKYNELRIEVFPIFSNSPLKKRVFISDVEAGKMIIENGEEVKRDLRYSDGVLLTKGKKDSLGRIYPHRFKDESYHFKRKIGNNKAKVKKIIKIPSLANPSSSVTQYFGY